MNDKGMKCKITWDEMQDIFGFSAFIPAKNAALRMK
jgi:hypothetical protein